MLFLAALSTILAVVLALPKPVTEKPGKKGGCGGYLPHGLQLGHEHNMTYGGDVNRNWLLFIPHGYSTAKPNPVVFSYHGGGRTPERQRDLDLLETPEFNTEYIVVYPRGIDVSGPGYSVDGVANTSQGRWEGTPNITYRDDVGYTNDILDELEKTLCVDNNRVFMTGKSNGGGFNGLAACHPQLSVRFAAFAPVAGSFYIEGQQHCDPSTVDIPCTPGRTDVPVMEIHGGNDTTIRYDGEPDRRGACLPGVRRWVEQWAARDGVGDEYVDSPRRTNLTGDAEVFTWGPASGEFNLITHVYEKAEAHSWPFTGPNADNGPLPDGNGDGPASYNATPAILEFFRGHPLR